MSEAREQLVEIVREKGLEHRPEAFQLASGAWSHDYIDGKVALAYGADLTVAAQAILDVCAERGISFEAVGGLTMGADHLSHSVAMLSGCKWFTVRKEAKGHGKQRQVEGGKVAGANVLLVEDVVTTGGSIIKALDAVEESGATVVLAICLVDRSGTAGAKLEERGVPFAPLMTWVELGIEPVVEPA